MRVGIGGGVGWGGWGGRGGEEGGVVPTWFEEGMALRGGTVAKKKSNRKKMQLFEHSLLEILLCSTLLTI